MAKRPSKKILEALADLAKALQRIEAPSMVIGGIAVIAHGVARQTVDIDATVLAARLDTSQVLEALADCSIRPRIPNFLEFVEESQVLLLVHEKTQVTLEISFAFTSFEQQALAQAVEVRFGGVKIAVASPETSSFTRRSPGGIGIDTTSSSSSPCTGTALIWRECVLSSMSSHRSWTHQNGFPSSNDCCKRPWDSSRLQR
jgi:hypothetical protein